jgi:nitrite reductase/ring-hydroxylating ferredoxin subunit
MYENLTVNAYASVTVEVEVRSSYLKKRGIVVGHFEVDDEVPAVGNDCDHSYAPFWSYK